MITLKRFHFQKYLTRGVKSFKQNIPNIRSGNYCLFSLEQLMIIVFIHLISISLLCRMQYRQNYWNNRPSIPSSQRFYGDPSEYIRRQAILVSSMDSHTFSERKVPALTSFVISVPVIEHIFRITK